MNINFGYVAISMKLGKISPNKTVTLKSLNKIDRKLWENKLEQVSSENLQNTLKILKYNNAYGIKFYRFTSKLIPLATHEELKDWKWEFSLKDKLEEIGSYVKGKGMRVGTHPDHFTLLNSPKKEVIEASIKDLKYHNRIFELMGLGTEHKMIIHVGGMYKNKKDSIKRFYEGFNMLDDNVKKRIALENDDKLFNAEEVLQICRDIKLPMVLDIHHDFCNPSSYPIETIIEDIFNTWENEKFPPKVHISSPKDEKNIRSHNDYVNCNDFLNFISKMKDIDCDFDCMVEAKMKDEALFKLVEELSEYKFIQKITDGSIWVDTKIL
ncbi:MAG: UV DNA damage repair endonuclease UvsE [Caloramator sp.]|nr:UV DNA damage repair endonuclease UvsE [Caloramator sp.]